MPINTRERLNASDLTVTAMIGPGENAPQGFDITDAWEPDSDIAVASADT